MSLSIIIPVLNEAPVIPMLLQQLAPLRQRGAQLIVVDGGSVDGSIQAVGGQADKVVLSERGRALQMNAGAAAASGDVLLFLHADTRLPEDADRLVARALSGAAVWGRFDVRIEGRHPMLRVVATMMNLRSRLTGIATGDQALFMRRASFVQVGGFPPLPLMEDIALSRMLRRCSRPACISEHVITSGRRWEAHGVWRTIALMWWLRLQYFFGVDAAALARHYRPQSGAGPDRPQSGQG
jgi:rSAM/selenodomain-associated transferase 2